MLFPNESASPRGNDTFDQLRNIAQVMFQGENIDLTNIAAKRYKLQELQKQQEEIDVLIGKSRQELARIDATWVTIQTKTEEVVKRTAAETELLGQLEKRRELHSKSVQKGEHPLRFHTACAFPLLDEYGDGYTRSTLSELESENRALSCLIDEQRAIICAIECDTGAGINVKSTENLREFVSLQNTQGSKDVLYRCVSLLSNDNPNTDSPSPADESTPSNGLLKLNELESQVFALEKVPEDEYNPDVLRRRIQIIRTDLLGVARRQYRIHVALDSIGQEIYERRHSIESLQRLSEEKKSSRTIVRENIDSLRSKIQSRIHLLEEAESRAAETDERIKTLRRQNAEILKEIDEKSAVLTQRIENGTVLKETYRSKVSAVETAQSRAREEDEEKQKLSAQLESVKEVISSKGLMRAECRAAVDQNKSLQRKAQAAFDGFSSCIGAGPYRITESVVQNQFIAHFAELTEVQNSLIGKRCNPMLAPQFPTLSTILGTHDAVHEGDGCDTRSSAQEFLDFLHALAGGDLTRNPPVLPSPIESSMKSEHIDGLLKLYEEGCQHIKEEVMAVEDRMNVSMKNHQRNESQCDQLSP